MWGPRGDVIFFDARYRDEETGPQTYMVVLTGQGRETIRVAGKTSGISTVPLENAVLYAKSDQGVFLYNISAKKEDLLFAAKGAFRPVMSYEGRFVAYSDIVGCVYVAKADGTERRKVFESPGAAMGRRFYWLHQGHRGQPSK